MKMKANTYVAETKAQNNIVDFTSPKMQQEVRGKIERSFVLSVCVCVCV